MVSSKKKILYIIEAMGGGIFSYIVDLANELVDKYDVYIAYSIRPQTPENFSNYFDERIHLIAVKNFCREINLKKEFMAIREIKAISENVKPDIIHLHSSKAGVLGRIAFNGKDVPLFYTPHGYSFLMCNYSSFKRKFFYIIEKLCAMRKCMTISCSLGEHQETLKLTKRAAFVNNSINTAKLKNIMDGVKRKEHTFTVFTLGRICYQKNPSLFNQIAEAMPDINFLWIGEGELKEELTAPNITVSGWIQREKALQLSMNADIFLLTSLWEGMPISILEAMYMKKPCVVSNVLGNRDVIHNGDNGYVCNTVEDFVRGIREIREGRAQGYIEKAYQDIFNQYTTKTQAKEYSRIYEISMEILDKHLLVNY